MSNKQLNRDQFVKNTRDPDFNDYYSRNNYPVIKKAITDQPRSMMPVWETRGLEQNYYGHAYADPQHSYTEILFENNIKF